MKVKIRTHKGRNFTVRKVTKIIRSLSGGIVNIELFQNKKHRSIKIPINNLHSIDVED